jgi:hypothetical protein
MTRDEQEAQSRKYEAAIVLPLSSGAFAVLTPDRQLYGIGDSAWLPGAVASAMALWTHHKVTRQAIEIASKPAKELNLEDLGL